MLCRPVGRSAGSQTVCAHATQPLSLCRPLPRRPRPRAHGHPDGWRPIGRRGSAAAPHGISSRLPMHSSAGCTGSSTRAGRWGCPARTLREPQHGRPLARVCMSPQAWRSVRLVRVAPSARCRICAHTGGLGTVGSAALCSVGVHVAVWYGRYGAW